MNEPRTWATLPDDVDYVIEDSIQIIKDIPEKELKSCFKQMERGDSGCFFWWLHRGDVWGYALVMGVQEVDGYFVNCVKLAKQKKNSLCSFDFDLDWDMPCPEKGNMFDSEIAITKDTNFTELKQTLIGYIRPFYETEVLCLNDDYS